MWILRVRKAINKYEASKGRLPKSGRLPAGAFDGLHRELKDFLRFSSDWELKHDYLKFMGVILKRDEAVRDTVVFEGK